VYGKIFQQIYEGSLATVGPWQALVTFQQFLILADAEGVVDKTAEIIARTTTIPLDIIKTGIQVLEQPDPDSRTPDEEGRRIVLLNPERRWGWRIVNYLYYRNLRSEHDRREYHRQYWRQKRSPKARRAQLQTLSNGQTQAAQQHSTNSTHADADADADADED
jgi:hypothetical protein